MSNPVVVRITTPAQLVASLPRYLGYVPSESLVVACLHEPRGRIGLTLRFDLPSPEHDALLVDDVVRRVRHESPTRLLLAVYTDGDDGRDHLFTELVAQLGGELDVTEAVLVRAGRFWSFLCRSASCCPPEGTPVEAAGDDEPIRLLAAEQVLRGQAVLPDREALERSLSGPSFLAAESALQCCDAALEGLATTSREGVREAWAGTVERFASAPAHLDDDEAAVLAVSLADRVLRDSLAAEHEPERILPLLAELCRRTPEPYDAAVCTLYAWVQYCDGGGAEVTIALERALRSDPTYSLALLLRDLVDRQVTPGVVRSLTQEAWRAPTAATRRARRSRRSRDSGS